MKLDEFRKEDALSVLSTADECVGKGLYTLSDFLSVPDDGKKFIYVLRDGERTAGYIYSLVTTPEDNVLFLSAGRGMMPQEKLIGRIQSVALKKEYRGMGYSSLMINKALDTFLEKGIESVYIVCWKPGGVLPLSKALRECGFTFVSIVENAWYKNERLYCPYCRGRCHCSGEVYMKKLTGEEKK